jgi:hypothetical protein
MGAKLRAHPCFAGRETKVSRQLLFRQVHWGLVRIPEPADAALRIKKSETASTSLLSAAASGLMGW